MRLFMDAMIALMLLALLGGLFWQHRTTKTAERVRDEAKAEVYRFQQQIHLQSALAKVPRNERGYPETVDPDWFNGNLPMNPLLESGHPWLEVASPDQRDLIHPPDRIATDKSVPMFWYNPHTGYIRTRVPPSMSDDASVELYNYINGSFLTELFASGAEKTK
ncbi:MAG: hypothetical protein L0Y44_03230 [Phycisphaerales bacterium]|nr:hypothetical protein [Phycisphaerales bacterium]